MAWKVQWTLTREEHEKVREGLILSEYQEGLVPLSKEEAQKIVNFWNSEAKGGVHWLVEVPDNDLPKERRKRIKAGLIGEESDLWAL